MFIAAQENLASALTALNRFDEAKEVVRQAGVLERESRELPQGRLHTGVSGSGSGRDGARG